MKQKIVIVGASINQNPLIERAKELGYETHVFAWQKGDIGEQTADVFYPISIVKRDEILETCKEINPDAVISIASNNAAGTAAYVSRNLGKKANSEDAVNRTIDKSLMRKALSEKKVSQPRYIIVGDCFDMKAIKELTLPLIVKPTDRSNSLGISLVTEFVDVIPAITQARLLSTSGSAIVEEFIDGYELFCECVSYKGKHTIASYFNAECTRNPDFTVHRLSQPVDFHKVSKKKTDKTVIMALNAVGIEYGASQVKLLIKDSEVFVLRISGCVPSNHMGTELIPISTKCDYLKLIIDIALDNKPVLPEFELQDYVSLRYFLGDEDRLLVDNYSKESIIVSNESCLITVERKREMGGTLPFELTYCGEFHTNAAVRLNSVRTALWFVQQYENAQRVWLPILYTPYVKKMFQDDNVEVCEYQITQQFEPEGIDYQKGDLVVLVNYYGVMNSICRKYAEIFDAVVIDNSFAFYDEPIVGRHKYTAYSCRRFFGVPDGAYLYGQFEQLLDLDKDISYRSMTHLMKSLEYNSSNVARKESTANESRVGRDRLLMSELTKRLMESVNYESVMERRIKNFSVLHKSLKEYQELQINEIRPAQCYPLLCDGKARAVLNSKGIHIPILWRKALQDTSEESNEYAFAQNVIALPIDQRYEAKDMLYLAQVVKTVLASL